MAIGTERGKSVSYADCRALYDAEFTWIVEQGLYFSKRSQDSGRSMKSVSTLSQRDGLLNIVSQIRAIYRHDSLGTSVRVDGRGY